MNTWCGPLSVIFLYCFTHVTKKVFISEPNKLFRVQCMTFVIQNTPEKVKIEGKMCFSFIYGRLLGRHSNVCVFQIVV